MATLCPKTGRALVGGSARSEPNSEGMKRVTPAATEASIRSFWPRRPSVPTQETMASIFCDWRASVRDWVELKSTGRTVALEG